MFDGLEEELATVREELSDAQEKFEQKQQECISLVSDLSRATSEKTQLEEVKTVCYLIHTLIFCGCDIFSLNWLFLLKNQPFEF